MDVAKVSKNTKYVTSCYRANMLNALTSPRCKDKLSGSSVTVDTADQCSTCFNNLNEPYIKCIDCVELLCLQCFANGREVRAHLNSHAYAIVRDDISVFAGTGNWTARDERLLLTTLSKQGYGNWEAVARAMHQRHTPDECQRHYHDSYFGGIFERLLGLSHASQTYFPHHVPYMTKMRSVDPPRHDDMSSMQFKMMAGYRCARGDFDTPYDCSAEALLTVVQEFGGSLDGNDTEQEETEVYAQTWRSAMEELQCGLVRAYNHRLSERRRRYRIMRAHGLIMANRTIGWISKYADALGTEANCSRFLSFMQISKPIQFDMLVESMKYFVDLRKTIFRLYELRRNGVRTEYGGKLYFKLKQQRLKQQNERAKSGGNAHDWRKLGLATNVSPLEQFHAMTTTMSPNTRKKAGPMAIAGMPGYTKLTDSERKLCSVERIMPQSYLDYKNILIAENIKHGHLRLAEARKIIKIDVNKTRQIYDFLIEHGHIRRAPS